MKSNIFYLLLTTLLFTACKKEEAKDSPITSGVDLRGLVVGDEEGKDGKAKENCFELVYPISITMPDGTVLSGNEKDLWTAVKTWYEANPDSEEKPSLNYPIEILWDGSIAKSIEDEEEMVIAKKYCKDKKEWKKDCFKLLLPLTWTMPDASTITVNEEEDKAAIKAWYEANPDSEGKPILNYPVDVLLEDGTTQTAADETEMEGLKEDCE